MADDSVLDDDVFEPVPPTSTPNALAKQYGYTSVVGGDAVDVGGRDKQEEANLRVVADELHKRLSSPTTTGYRGDAERRVPIIDDYDPIHKTILVGDSGVGKTSLLVQFDTGGFNQGAFAATVGIGFTNKVVTVDDSKVKLQIWDTAGQERFRSVTHAYYRDAHALLLLYDVTNRTSYDNTRAWLAEVNEYAQEDVVIMLLGNKSDCGQADRAVRFEEGEKLAREYNVAFMETSAKTGLNVDLAFMAIARELKHRRSKDPANPKFNVTEYVRSESQRSSCNCNAQ